jgi:hypothetical protein
LKPAVGCHDVRLSIVRGLELFRPQQGVDKVREQSGGDGGEQRDLDHQRVSFAARLSQPATYAMLMRKKAKLAMVHPKSHMVGAPVSGAVECASSYGKAGGIKSR